MNLAELEGMGIHARLDDDGELVLSAAPGTATPAIRGAIAEAKNELLAELRGEHVNLVNVFSSCTHHARENTPPQEQGSDVSSIVPDKNIPPGRTDNPINTGRPAATAEIINTKMTEPQDQRRQPSPQEQDQRHWGWLLHFDNGEVVERYIIPEPTHAEVMSFYPDVIAAEPVDNPARVGAGNTPVRDELLRELVSGHDDMVRIFAPDDRRTCKQCLNLRFNVCVVAAPSSLALVVANRGYRPNQTQLQRCRGYAPNASDKDQRTGEERWPNLN